MPREVLTSRRRWQGVEQGAPVGTGVPARAQARIAPLGRAPTAQQRALHNVVLLEGANRASGVHLALRRGGATLSCVVTCLHAVPDAASARATRACLNHDRGPLPREHHTLAPRRLFVADACHDLVAVALAGPPLARPALACCAQAKVGAKVACAHHPNAVETVVSAGALVYAGDDTLLHDCDTLPGSSGGALFDARWRMLGVHRGGGEMLSGRINEASPIQPLLALLEERGWSVAR